MTAARLALTALALALVLGALEFAAHSGTSGALHDHDKTASPNDTQLNLTQLIPELRERPLLKDEIGRQYVVQNVKLFSHFTHPDQVDTAYVGTSRTKVVRPSMFGFSNRIVGAGNSYTEASYGLLLQAEILRPLFPKLKTLYVESSLLLRRPAKLRLDPSHKEYASVIRSFEPLCRAIEAASTKCTPVFSQLGGEGTQKNSKSNSTTESHLAWFLHPKLLDARRDWRITTLLIPEKTTASSKNKLEGDPWFTTVAENGERIQKMNYLTTPDEAKPPLSPDNIKVQRLRDIPSTEPWDGLFDLFAEWGKVHGIRIVFFQPPVRQDLYDFQVQHGLRAHTADLERISKRYGIPFIDLDKPELGYVTDPSLFSDEDHLETCLGTGLLTLALDASLAAGHSISKNELLSTHQKDIDGACHR